MSKADAGVNHETDPEYLEPAHRKALDTSGGSSGTALGRLNPIATRLASFVLPQAQSVAILITRSSKAFPKQEHRFQRP